MNDGVEEALEEGPATPEDNGSGEKEFDNVASSGLELETERRSEHGEEEQRHGEGGADPEAGAHGKVFGIGLVVSDDVHGLQGHAAFGADARAVLDDFRVHGAGVTDVRGGSVGLRVNLRASCSSRSG